jgi:hypothetical protein
MGCRYMAVDIFVLVFTPCVVKLCQRVSVLETAIEYMAIDIFFHLPSRNS